MLVTVEMIRSVDLKSSWIYKPVLLFNPATCNPWHHPNVQRSWRNHCKTQSLMLVTSEPSGHTHQCLTASCKVHNQVGGLGWGLLVITQSQRSPAGGHQVLTLQSLNTANTDAVSSQGKDGQPASLMSKHCIFRDVQAYLSETVWATLCTNSHSSSTSSKYR